MARGRAFGALLAAAATLPAQILMPQPEGIAHPIPSDLAVLEAQESRKDLPCSVDPLDTVLGFDLKFHAGYEATVPLKELGGGNYDLTMVFRVTPASSPESAAYFIQRIPVPKIDRDAKGDATLHGAFDLGEGHSVSPGSCATARAGSALPIGKRKRRCRRATGKCPWT